MIIGVLALQGDYSLHVEILYNNKINSLLIKEPKQLSKIDALIIPGGESTVILKLLHKFNFIDVLNEFASKKSIYGTCAGAILMSKSTDDKMKTLNYINVKSFRNYWGRQVNSFTEKVKLGFKRKPFLAHFIRAPKFKCESSDLIILAHYKNEPILIRNKKHLISSFHPEMTNDFSIHKYFIDMVKNAV